MKTLTLIMLTFLFSINVNASNEECKPILKQANELGYLVCGEQTNNLEKAKASFNEAKNSVQKVCFGLVTNNSHQLSSLTKGSSLVERNCNWAEIDCNGTKLETEYEYCALLVKK